MVMRLLRCIAVPCETLTPKSACTTPTAESQRPRVHSPKLNQSTTSSNWDTFNDIRAAANTTWQSIWKPCNVQCSTATPTTTPTTHRILTALSKTAETNSSSYNSEKWTCSAKQPRCPTKYMYAHIYICIYTHICIHVYIYIYVLATHCVFIHVYRICVNKCIYVYIMYSFLNATYCLLSIVLHVLSVALYRIWSSFRSAWRAVKRSSSSRGARSAPRPKCRISLTNAIHLED